MIRKSILGSLVVALLGVVVFVSSCKKEIDTIGVEIVGENPLQLITIDTITINTHSELVDSLRTDELTMHLLGAYHNSVFGTTNASVYTQFRLSESTQGFNFGSNPLADSLILYIKYKQKEVYGDSSYTQHLSVYELDEALDRDTAYYAFQSSAVLADKVGEVSFIPAFDTLTYVEEGDTLTKTRPITIPLTPAMAERMLSLGEAAYADNEAFLEAFKGLWITTDDADVPVQGGAMMFADFNHVETYMRLYYHNDENDSLYYDYIVNNNSARYSSFNHYNYTHADAEFIQQVISQDTAMGMQQLYLQGMGGVHTSFSFPYIDNLPDKLIVNEARLYLYNLEEEDEDWKPVSQITISHPIVNEGKTDTLWYRIPDVASGEQYFGGDYNSETNAYAFRITQELQNMISGKTSSRELRFTAESATVNPAFLRFGGSRATDGKAVKLRLICTQVPD